MEKTVINAFHPDYVKTYEPNLMQHFRTASAYKKASATLSDNVEEIRKTDPSYGYIGLGKEPRDIKAPKMMKRKKPAAEITAELIERLKPRSYHTFAKAGTPKGKK